MQTAIRIANDLSAGEIAGSPVARDTLTLLQHALERDGLPLTATGNLSRAVVAEMCKLIEWPGYDHADAFRFNKVISEPDFLALYVVRTLAQAATLVRAQREKLVATTLGNQCEAMSGKGAYQRFCFISQREGDSAMQHPGAVSGTWDGSCLRHGGENPATAAVVRTFRVP